MTLISWEAEHPEQQIGQAFYRQKNHTICILHTGYKVIDYMFAKQSYRYKLRGLLFKLKAILLVQTARAFSSLAAFYWVHIYWLALGHPMGAGNPTISRETKTQVPAACQPQQPHLFLSFKNQQEE